MILDYYPVSASSSSFSRISIYPDPAESEIMIECDYEIERISIYDIYGKMVLCFKLEKNHMIDIESLQKGYYLLKAESESKSYTTRFIKE